MRVAAWNIQNGGGGRIGGISRALSDVQSDVCVLSEFTIASSQRLSSALKRHADAFRCRELFEHSECRVQ
jgi:hypothetical protein